MIDQDYCKYILACNLDVGTKLVILAVELYEEDEHERRDPKGITVEKLIGWTGLSRATVHRALANLKETTVLVGDDPYLII